MAAEALRVCTEFVRVIRCGSSEPVDDRAALVPPLFQAVFARLQATEQDQEVKEAAIAGMGHVISALGDSKGASPAPHSQREEGCMREGCHPAVKCGFRPQRHS